MSGACNIPSPHQSAADYFGAMVGSYDSLIRRAVPRYDAMTQRLIEHLPADVGGVKGAVRVLELGCGTGNLTLRLLERFPRGGGVVTTVDASPEMTALTAARAQARGEGVGVGVGERLRTVTARFEELSFPPGSFDLAASCMSLHHVRDKGALYRAIAEWLVPGGVLVFADQLRGATEAIQRAHWDLWLEFCREPGHCTEEELKGLLDHAAAHDRYTPLCEHFDLLARAGFVEKDCVWRNGMYTVVSARRG